jgi:phage-related protein (TIGR01555 family)
MDGLAEMNATPEGQVVLQNRFDTIAQSRSTLGMTAIDSKDKYSRTNTSVGGLADVLEQQAYVVAAACGYPVSILLGIIKGGLSTGDNDVRSWYADVDNFRQNETKPNLETAYRWIMKSSAGPLAGKEPAVWSVAFRDLWEPTEKEKAETFALYAEADEKNITKSGIYSADDAAKSRFGGDGFGTKIVIDWKAREAQKKLDEELAEQMNAAAVDAMDPTADPNADDPDAPPTPRDRTEPEE